MTAVDLKALPWQPIDPSSIILGPEMKFFLKKVQFLHTQKLHFIIIFFCPVFAKTYLVISAFLRTLCCQLKRVITGIPRCYI